MELFYPQEDGLDLLRRLRLRQPHCHVLIFTESTDEQGIGRMLYGGALGDLLKNVTSAIRQAQSLTFVRGRP